MHGPAEAVSAHKWVLCLWLRASLPLCGCLVQYGTHWTLCRCSCSTAPIGWTVTHTFDIYPWSCGRYLAIVKGRLEGSGRSDIPLQGKAATTDYRAEAHTDSCGGGSQEGGGGGGGGSGWGCCLTTVSLWPRTGRTHQLRKHMAYLGHPILGDPRYRWVRYCTAVLVPGHQYCRCW